MLHRRPTVDRIARTDPGPVQSVQMPLGLGIWEILILAGVLVLLFGAKGAPAMARRLGTGVREMKEAVTDMDPRSLFDQSEEPDAPPPRRELEAAKPVAAPRPGESARRAETPESASESPPQ